MAKPSGSDSARVEQAQAGDGRAQAEVLSGLEPVLRAYFTGRIGPRSEVDDLVQNPLLRIHNSLPDLKHPERLKGFALKAALFELQDLYRGRYSAKERLFDPEYPPEMAVYDGSHATRIDLEYALARLSPTARRIIELREYGYRYEEIADMIGSTEAAIKMQVKRAFEKLRDVLVPMLVAIVLTRLYAGI